MAQRKAILYVDDEAPNRVVFEKSFEHRFRIVTAANGEQALLKMEQEPIGVVVTDQRMPGMTGNELLARVRSIDPTIVRVVITAYSDLDAILRAVNEGLVARYVVKPWDAAELEEMLSWAVSAHELGLESEALQRRLLATERLATVGSVAAGVLHDVLQPISHLSLNADRLSELAAAAPSLAELLKLSGQALPPAEQKLLSELVIDLPEIAEEMLEAIQLAVDLIGTMKRMSRRPEPSKAPPAEPHRTAAFAVQLCRDATTASSSRVILDVGRDLQPVNLDAPALTRVLVNLVQNALHALGEGASETRDVQVTGRAEGALVRLSVIDTGPGMPPDVLQRAGTPFFTTKRDGTGIGLSQCRRIIEGAGGTLNIESTLGKGTAVHIVLPSAP